MKSAQQLREEAKELIKQSREADEKARQMRAQAHMMELRELRERADLARKLLSDRLFDQIGDDIGGLNSEQHAVIFEEAWDRGHSSGDHAVESEYGSLAEFVRKVMDAAD